MQATSLAIDRREPLPSRRLSAAAARTLAVRILGPACSFALAMLLARMLGPAGTGALYVTLAVVAAISIFPKFGLETALQRFVGAASGRGDADAVIGIYRQSLHVCVALAVPIGAVTVAFAPAFARHVVGDASQTELVVRLALLVVPCTLLGVNAAMMKALGRPAWGGFLEAGAWPLLTLGLMGMGMLMGEATPATIATAYVLAAVTASVLGHATVRGGLPSARRPAPMPWPELRGSCASLTGIELINYALLWAPFVMLPAIAGVHEAGLYSISHRLAAQLGLLMLVVASVTCTSFAAHHDTGRNGGLARLAGRATRLLIGLALPPTVVLLLWAEPVLGLFGEEFPAAATTLRVLVLGQLVSLAMGPAGYLLAMTGHERALRNVLLATVAMLVPLATVLVATFGATGAAVAVSSAMAFQSLACAAMAARRLRLPFLLALAR